MAAEVLVSHPQVCYCVGMPAVSPGLLLFRHVCSHMTGLDCMVYGGGTWLDDIHAPVKVVKVVSCGSGVCCMVYGGGT